jgi:hypothetical protein
VASFYSAIVTFAPERVTFQLSSQGLQESFLQSSNLLGAISSELLAPVGLESDGVCHTVGSEPQEGQNEEGQAVRAVQTMAVGQEAKASATVTGCPLIAREMVLTQVVPKGGAESLLV